jgi:hypothetical protein
VLQVKDGDFAAEVSGQGWGLVLERARMYAHRGEWEKSRRMLERCWSQRSDPGFVLPEQVRVALLYGLTLRRLDREAEGQAIWSQMLQDKRIIARTKDVENVIADDLLELIILRGMVGNFDQPFVDEVGKFALIRLGSSGGAAPLLNQFPLTAETMNGMWKSVRGQAIAVDTAQGNSLSGEQVRGFLQLYAYQMMRQGTGTDVSPAEEELVWNLAEIGFGHFTEGDFSVPTFLQLGLAWKGIPAPLGWKFAFAGVPDDMRGPSAYVLARRFQLRAQPAIAKDLFQLALEYAGENQALLKLVNEQMAK